MFQLLWSQRFSVLSASLVKQLSQSEQSTISIDNGMNASASKDFHYEWNLKILSKLDEPLGECNLREFSNILSSENP